MTDYDEIEGERQAIAAVRDLFRQAAEIAVPWRMDMWGDGDAGALIRDFRKALWEAHG